MRFYAQSANSDWWQFFAIIVLLPLSLAACLWLQSAYPVIAFVFVTIVFPIIHGHRFEFDEVERTITIRTVWFFFKETDKVLFAFSEVIGLDLIREGEQNSCKLRFADGRVYTLVDYRYRQLREVLDPEFKEPPSTSWRDARSRTG